MKALGAALPGLVPPLPVPFPDPDDISADTPQWGKDAREEIKWYVAEKFFSPFAGVMNVDDDRRGGPWVQNSIKEMVRVQLGVQRRTPQAPQAVAPGGPSPRPAPPAPGTSDD